MTTEPLLDLAEDTPPRPFIRGADGSDHYLQVIDDLGLNQRRELQRAWARVNAITEKQTDITKQEEKEYTALYAKMTRLLLPSLKSADVKALGIERQEAIAQAFFTYRTAHQMMQRLMANAASPSATGSDSSPSSSTTTAAPPSEGATGATSP